MNNLIQALLNTVSLARISQMIPQIADGPASPFKSALLEALLPSLHYLALVGSLDEMLAGYISANSVPWPRKTKEDLFNRIKVVAASVPALDAAALHEMRERRNHIAHEPTTISSDPVTWTELNDAVDMTLSTIVTLRLVATVPTIEAFYERKPEVFPDELGPNGERLLHKHVAGAQCNGAVIIEFAQEISYFPPNKTVEATR